MSERIQELAEQADVEWLLEHHPKLEKFAELLVKECADQFKLIYTDEQYQRRIDKTILKHFGFYE